MKRHSGVLMHVSSLPCRYGCGSFGKSAYDFIDFLVKGGFSIWQVLPFSVPDEYGSPYKAISAFAGNPYFIDLDLLCTKGLLSLCELDGALQDQPYLCDFERLSKERVELLRKASKRVSAEERVRINDFVCSNPNHDNYCVYMALKSANGGKDWREFEESVTPDPEEIFMHRFIQHEFYEQWMRLKAYANERGISVIGDMPIYVDTDSADLYFNQKCFQLDKSGRPERVAGVPPDYFSPDGQLWGNPLYDWDYMKKEGYTWWLERIKWQLTLFDGIRIDHFRAFSEYFSVGADEPTAINGKWRKGPGLSFVNKLKEAVPDKLIIAEDLGDIDEKVVTLLKKSALPGMRVFQFAFLGKDTPHMPHNYPENCVAYSGTHDNNTLLGYLWELDDATRAYMLDYCNHRDDWKSGTLSIMKKLLSSHACRVIFPIQDILGYGSDTRMNRPGVAKGNWQYRVTEDQLKSVDLDLWKRLNKMYGR